MPLLKRKQKNNMQQTYIHAFKVKNKPFLVFLPKNTFSQISDKEYKDLKQNSNFYESYFYYADKYPALKIDKDNFQEQITLSMVKAKSRQQKLSVCVNLTSECNMDCKYCFRHQKQLEKYPSIMTKDNAIKIIDFFFQFKNHKNIYFSFTAAGEAFLNFDMVQFFIAYSQKKAHETGKVVTFGITTNGTLLTEKKVQYFQQLSSPVDVKISLDGATAIENKFRVGKVDGRVFDEIIKNCKIAHSYNTGKIVFVMIHGKTKNLVELYKGLIEMGFEKIQLNMARLSEENKLYINRAGAKHIVKEYEKLVDFIIDKTNEKDFRYIKAFLNNYEPFSMYLRSFLFRKKQIDGQACAAGKTRFFVETDGTIFPCLFFKGEDAFNMGNVSDKEIVPSVWTYSESKQCKMCWMRKVCGGGCPYDNYIATGDVFNPNSVKCYIYRSFLELAIYFLNALGKKIVLLMDFSPIEAMIKKQINKEHKKQQEAFRT